MSNDPIAELTTSRRNCTVKPSLLFLTIHTHRSAKGCSNEISGHSACRPGVPELAHLCSPRTRRWRWAWYSCRPAMPLWRRRRSECHVVEPNLDVGLGADSL